MKSEVSYSLTDGPVFSKLLKLSLPIMATSLMQTAHSLTNMFWLSWLGEGYIAAAGLVTQFVWLSMSLIMLCRMGAEIGVSQNIGKGDMRAAKSYAQNGFLLAVTCGVLFAVLLLIFRNELLTFFSIESEYVANLAQQYMAIMAIGVPFNFGHFVITGIFSGSGNTKLPFYINTAALVLNIALTPLFIFVFDMGIIGAATGMSISAIFNFVLKIWAMKRYKNRPFEQFNFLVKIKRSVIVQISRWGAPVAVEHLLFTFLFMLITRLVTSFGEGAVAAQQVGLQVESLSFMIGNGFGSALTAFVGQNYGAQKIERLRSTFKVSFIFMGAYGLIMIVFLYVFAPYLLSIFLYEEQSLYIGTSYLRIMALTQFLFSLDRVAIGGFQGRGKTLTPGIVSVSSNVIRVVLSYILASTALGIHGVWWGIAIAMTVRSIWILIWHFANTKKIFTGLNAKPIKEG